MRIVCFGLAAVLLLSGGIAGAREVVPLVPKMEPQAAAERIVQFHESLARGLRAGGLSVMEPAKVRARLKLGVEQAGCDEGPCVQMARGLLGPERLATAKVSAVGKNYSIEVRLFDGASVLARASGHCDICTNAEALETLARLATEVGTKGEEPPAAAKDPPSAPQPAAAAPVAPAAPGPTPAVPAPTPGPDQPMTQVVATRQPRQWPLWPALAASGVGVLGLAVGIPLIAMDGGGTNCRGGDALPDKTNCKDLYSTKGGGWALTAMGLGSLVGSGVLFYLHYGRSSKEQRQAHLDQIGVSPVLEGGAVLGASGRF